MTINTTANESKFCVRCGNFEIRNSTLRNKGILCDLNSIKELAIEKANSDSFETIGVFESKEDAIMELQNHKSYIDKAQFFVGTGYTGAVYWVDEESNDGECVDTLEYSDFECNLFVDEEDQV